MGGWTKPRLNFAYETYATGVPDRRPKIRKSANSKTFCSKS